MTGAESVKPVSSCSEAVKRKLDPAFSYMIFEKAGGESEFQQVVDILLKLDLIIHEMKFFLDEAKGKLLLVVKFDPGPTDKIMQEFLSVGLPEDLTFYAYGSHFADQG